MAEGGQGREVEDFGEGFVEVAADDAVVHGGEALNASPPPGFGPPAGKCRVGR